MKKIRRGLAAVLLAVMCMSNVLSTAYAAQAEPTISPEISAAVGTAQPALELVPMTEKPTEAPETSPQPSPLAPSQLNAAPSPDAEEKRTTQLEATVPAALSNYSVTIPEGVALGQLDPAQDFVQTYAVQVTMENSTGSEKIIVRSPDDFPLYRENSQTELLTCYNSFGEQYFTKTETREGELRIKKEAIAAAAEGHYAGILNFTVIYDANGVKPDETPTPTPTQKPVPTATPEVKPTATPVIKPTAAPVVTPTPQPEQGSTEFYTADVSMRHADHFDKLSMCNKLFYPKADIKITGENAQLTLYVIDPVPSFAADGTPLSNVKAFYQGGTYPASVDSKNKVAKHFDAAPGFIEKSGDYASSLVVFQLPKQALWDSVSGKLSGAAYVNAVMHTDVEFKICLENLTKVESEPENKPTAAPVVKPTATPAATEKPTPTPEATEETENTENGDQSDGYYTAKVTMRHSSDFNKLSMCNKLFFPKADIKIAGDNAQLTLYVVDPVPKFVNEGTPLSNVKMQYNGKSYTASVQNNSKVTKYFNAADGFIDKAGDYSASPVVVNLPKAAIEASKDGKLKCTAYVNAVMHTDVDFYICLADLRQTSGKPSNKPASNKNKYDADDAETFAEESTAMGDAEALTMDSGEKTYFTSDVTMRRADDFNRESMCNPLFYPKADIVVQGETAQLTLYVIDPVPKFAEEGTPLSDVFFIYDGKNYAATQDDKQVKRHFDLAPGFIEQAGDYTATPVRVILPKAAIEASKDGKLKCSAYINAVMHVTQQFYVALENLEETDGLPEEITDKPDSLPTAPEEAGAVQTGAAAIGAIRLETKMLPQMLGYLAVTAAILAVAMLYVWNRRR